MEFLFLGLGAVGFVVLVVKVLGNSDLRLS